MASTAPSSVPFSPDEAALMAAAQAMLPILRERALDCERQRKVPDESIEMFRDAGFFRILQPSAYGGYELSPRVLFRISSLIARACPSSAWVMSILAIHNWEVALMDPRVAEELWGMDDEVRISSSYAPFGKAQVVPGGYRVSGRWGFSSGCDHATWAILGVHVPKADGEEGNRLVAALVAPGDYTIDQDSWHVAGLRGTGSKDVVVDDAFVPEHRVHDIQAAFALQEIGNRTFTAPIFRHPFGIIFAYMLASVAMGVAEGALEAYLDIARKRANVYTGAKAEQDPINQKRIAEAFAMVDGMRLRFDRDFAEMEACVAEGRPAPVERRIVWRLDTTHIAREAAEVAQMVFRGAGGSGLQDSAPMQRFLRDANAIANHATTDFDRQAVNFGGYQLSGQLADRLL